MFRKEPIPDKTVLKSVNQRLTRTGMGARCRVTATVSRGRVTLAGTIQYENQRRPALRAASLAEGVKGVVDQLTVEPRDAHRR
jgi:osmotically-inducible protein OsmY